ncbi:DUF2853 family protein [Halothiobacillus sp. DCM-1]|uniref:DUF2853 family protein n=1 Tax=Halothiobacillus sp. DCM-1 TaxID=3112558 RepID=UPI00324C71E4
MSGEYLDDVRKYSPKADSAVVEKIVKYCGIALQSRDASYVSASDPKELQRVREGFATKKLGLNDAQWDEGLGAVLKTLAGVNLKSRVTFYYLLAEATGTLDKI